MRPRVARAGWSAVVVLGLALAACGGDDEGGLFDADGQGDEGEQAGGEGPTADDHWHLAYGFDLCDRDEPAILDGTKEEMDASGQPESEAYFETGVHSHDDGVIHWHSFSAAATGSNARFGLFLDTYEVELTDSSLTFPDDQLDGAEYVEGETSCGGEDGQLVLAVWENFADDGDPKLYTQSMSDVRIDQDGMVFLVAFVPQGTDARDLEMPPWAADLPELGAADGGS